MRKLQIERVRLWNPTTGETRYEFHIFDPKNPSVLIDKTSSIDQAEKFVARST